VVTPDVIAYVVLFRCPHCGAAVVAGQGPYWGVMTAASGEPREWIVADGSGTEVHRCIEQDDQPDDTNAN